MRYRHFGASGTVVSAVSLVLDDDLSHRNARDWTSTIYAALENGVNTFEVAGRDPVIADGLAQALSTLDRNLVVVIWRLARMPQEAAPVRDFSAEAMAGQVRAALARTKLGYLDVLMLDEPDGPLPQDGLLALDALKQAGAIRLAGIGGDGEAMDPHLNTGKFDVFATTYNFTSGWKERNRIRAAVQNDIAVIGRDSHPLDFCQAAVKTIAKPDARNPLAGVGAYSFLANTPNWAADEICLSYALTDPSIATVQIAPPSLDRMEKICGTPEREMPPGLAAQIEMSRFAPDPKLDRRTA